MAFVEENELVCLLLSFLEQSDVVRARISHASGSLMIGSRRLLPLSIIFVCCFSVVYFEHPSYYRISFVEGMNNIENHMDERVQVPRQHRRCQERCRKVISEVRRFKIVCNLQCVLNRDYEGECNCFRTKRHSHSTAETVVRCSENHVQDSITLSVSQ